MHKLCERVIGFLKEYELQDKTVITGFSGGYDSMCLLNILSEIKKLEGFEELNIIAAHYNHNWRGEESLREQEICRIFAASRGVEFYTKNAPLQMLFLPRIIKMITRKLYYTELLKAPGLSV